MMTAFTICAAALMFLFVAFLLAVLAGWARGDRYDVRNRDE